MNSEEPAKRYPWWVRITMLGAASRRALVFWSVLYFGSAVASVLIGLFFEDDLTYAVAFAGLFVFLGAAHWLTLRWLARHGVWD